MAITQVSKITHRKGLQENLPQLDGAELGWAIDGRRLYIGNGDLTEGASIIGNTEILTEFSDILGAARSYTYEGLAAGYLALTGRSSTNPTARTMQSKFDDFASVKDFGAIGDGSIDDTAAINDALFELFSRQINTEVRRSLYFPAGIYKVTDTIKIPPYVRLWGEGINSSIIKYTETGSAAAVVVRTADSLQQVGTALGDNVAIMPTNIEISNMTIESTAANDLIYFENVDDSYMNSVGLIGNLPQSSLSTAGTPTAGIRIKSTTAVVSTSLTFDKCSISNITYGIHVDDKCQSVTVSNSRFDTLYKGVELGETPVNGGPEGFKVIHNMFDNVSAQGIEVGDIALNSSAFNVFYDVGNDFNGIGSPISPVIEMNNTNNVSMGDMYERTDSDNSSQERIRLTIAVPASYAASNAVSQTSQSGSLYNESGRVIEIANNISSALTIFNTEAGVNNDGFEFKYTIKRGDTSRSGVMTVSNEYGANALSYNDDYNENTSTGVTLSASQTGSTVSIDYISDNTTTGIISYSVSYMA